MSRSSARHRRPSYSPILNPVDAYVDRFIGSVRRERLDHAIVRLPDVNGSLHSDWVRFTERFRRPIFGKFEIEVAVEDPKSYTKPFTVRIDQRVMIDEEPIEFVCKENHQFRRHGKID